MSKVIIPLKRLIPALIIGPGTWLGPYIAMVALFLPSLIQEIDEANKVNILALFMTTGVIASAISNMVAGELSDRTRSRFGKRAPIIVLGSFVFSGAMIAAAYTESINSLLVAWIIGQIGLNFIVAPMVAWLDYAPAGHEGIASSAYGGLGMALGNNGFNVLAALYLGQYRTGFIVFAIISFIGTMLAVILVREPSNLDEEKVVKEKKQKLSITTFIREAFPAWSKGRDYYLALIGKMFLGIGNFAITGYLLYLLTDFLKLGDATEGSVQLINSIMFILGILMGFFAGPFTDKYKLLKLPVAISPLFLAIGALSLYFMHNTIGIICYGFFAGFGMGLWNSLDNLLNIRVIPDEKRVAFFLGIYNLGNSIPQAVGPILSAFSIALFGYEGIFVVSFVFAVLGSLCIFKIRSVSR
ncbi:MFS transporter [Lonepinella koalarum]|uniref:MFS transporter n=1 Tax=Lonepinella koalarum TaxID=53417 RepID=UPI0011E4186A|nr:MFS transporter [Lonepinella koalarum]TYG34867.1 MFS transporter [Lonepinella koalarum]